MIKKLIAALLVTSVLAGGTSLVPRNALAYNRPAAANYADAFWSAFNNAYPYFGAPPWPASIISNGDDCTNFVSQALHAGGIATREAANEPWQAVSSTTYWYAHTNGGGLYGKAGWTTSWSVVGDNETFLQSTLHASIASYTIGAGPGKYNSYSGGAQGDVVGYAWTGGANQHAAIIDSTDGQYVDTHSTDHGHVFYTLADYNGQWQTTWATVYHIPDSAS